MEIKIIATEMYLEVARAFASANIIVAEGNKWRATHSNQLPPIILANLRYAKNSIAIIFSYAFLEAYVNTWLHQMLLGNVPDELAKALWLDSKQKGKSLERIQEFREKYKDEKEREDLFRYKSLSDKIKLLHKLFIAKMPDKSEYKDVRKLWNDFKDLEKLRHRLVHYRPDSIPLDEFEKFIDLSPEELRRLVQISAHIIDQMINEVPTLLVNIGENVLIRDAALAYRDHPILEQFIFGKKE